LALDKVDDEPIASPDDENPQVEGTPAADMFSPMGVGSPIRRGDCAEMMARRSFIIAKAHLLYLYKKEQTKAAAEAQTSVNGDQKLMFIDVQKVVH